MTTSVLLRVEAARLDEAADAVSALESTGYVAVIAGDHDLMVDVFCRDVPHLNRVLRDEIQQIPGVLSVTSYLVTEVRYESKANMASLLDGDDEAELTGPALRRDRSA